MRVEYSGVGRTYSSRSVKTSKEEELECLCKAATLAVGAGTAEADGVNSKR